MWTDITRKQFARAGWPAKRFDGQGMGGVAVTLR
jgi:hypothetical protein